VESYQYDTGDRVIARIDALTKAAGYQYDGAGRLAQFTDRKGQLTTYQYDPADRVTRINYPDATHTRTYDTVGRLAEIREAASSMTYTYDNAERLVGVVTDSAAGRHEIAYDYDTLDRVTRRTVNGTDITTYAYDNASRLTAISYRNQTTSYEWDSASRLTVKTLPNGIRQAFAYDDADRLLSITYQKSDASLIEAIAYTYDAKGQRLTKSTGSASVWETGFSAVYDAVNRMTSLTLTGTGQSFTLAYDDNGNLVSKTETANPSNLTTYAWDSRNRLSGITAPGINAGFKYDPLGRRIEKSVNGQTIGYVYDGAQAIGEVAGGTINATILSGLAIDEVIARYTVTGSRTYLTDALGSVLALAKDDQAIQAFYAYTPYGETTVLGTDEGNPIQYTARENDQTGLYYYRARYYDPVLKRFIAEDPIGLAAGPNVYSYVGGNPVNYVDPSGNCPWCAVGFAVGVWANIAGQLAQNGGNWGQLNPWQVAIAGAAGALTGGIGTAAAGFRIGGQIAANVIGSGIVGAGQKAANNIANGSCIGNGVGIAAIQGAVFGAIGLGAGAVYNAAANAATRNSFLNISNSVSGPFYPAWYSVNNWAAGGSVGGNAFSTAVGAVGELVQ